MCKHCFGVQLLQNPPLCSITEKSPFKSIAAIWATLVHMCMLCNGSLDTFPQRSTVHEQLFVPFVKKYTFSAILSKNNGKTPAFQVTFQPPFRKCSRNQPYWNENKCQYWKQSSTRIRDPVQYQISSVTDRGRIKRKTWYMGPIDQRTIKTPNPKCRLYWCLIEFIDWRPSQSCWYFRPIL